MTKIHTYPIPNKGYVVEIVVDNDRITKREALEEAEREIRRELIRTER